MNLATKHLDYQTIQEWIDDNDTIVTVPYLAKTKCISIQDSQNLLDKFIKDQKGKSKPHELSITYILRGSLRNAGGKAIFLAMESDLNAKRDSLENVDDEMVFSVQKSKSVDLSDVAFIDTPDVKENNQIPGSIVGKNCIKRKVQLPVLCTKKETISTLCSDNSMNNQSQTKQLPKSSSRGGIANLFNNLTTNQKKLESDNELRESKTNLLNFTKVPSKNSKRADKNNENEKKSENTKPQITSNKELTKIEDEFERNDNNRKEDSLSKESKASSKSTRKKDEGKRQREASVDNKNTKRRKRIVERNDSESDDLFENIADDADIIEKSDDESNLAPSSSSPVEERPALGVKKQRKAVDNVYLDDEGFLVTKTEYVHEPVSEVDNEIPIPIAAKKLKMTPCDEKKSCQNDVSSKKVTKSKKSFQNQPTLMNFFKKK